MPRESRISNAYTQNIYLFTLCIVTSFFILIWAFTGKWPLYSSPYNSYLLQADSWLSGRLDLAQNYKHLELAQFNGHYYVSFPPLPSVLLLPFTLLFGANAPDGLLGLVSIAGICFFSIKLLQALGKSEAECIFWSLFILIGSNTAFICAAPWVWFLAQNLSFCFTLAALYFAVVQKGGCAVFALVCAAGCRPFQAVYLPLVLYLCWPYKEGRGGFTRFIRRYWRGLLAASLLVFFYCALNYARFQNPFEFGHNYLPEFLDAPHGQFSFTYIIQNAVRLIAPPRFEDGRVMLEEFDGSALWISMPVFLSLIWYLIYYCYHRDGFSNSRIWQPFFASLLALMLICLHVVLLLSHKTLGGWHFGNRYFVDVLPCVLLIIGCVSAARDRLLLWQLPLFVFGMGTNLVGTVLLFNG